MKKVLFFVSTVFAFQACKKVDLERSTVSNSLQSVNYGVVHNEYMDNLLNFQADTTITSFSDKKDYVIDFHTSYSSQSSLSASDQNDVNSSLNDSKDYLDLQKFIDQAVYGEGSFTNNYSGSYFKLYSELLTDSKISTLLATKMIEIGKLAKQNLDGTLPDDALYNSLKLMQEEVKITGITIDQGELAYLQSVLDIGVSSYEWWSVNSSEISNHYKVAPWIIADLIGAGFSGGIALLVQPDGDINWKAVLAAGLGGAIASSTGGALRIARYLFG
ncbi:hypothetical protein [Luteibaculum oceani]|uniref:Uncharacterized protein n=1 Tax=Luteibaculum oceani TaxID=1294296 RepID=A0A5C6UTY8_9FLAO|nr:hypothetical protein [Luteibaculum oceani]TXC76094.1 hypothetical protein FRX97_11315 [Luteibaculum oceani]